MTEYLWFSLIPPIIVIVLAMITRRISVALLSGVISAALIYSHGNIPSALIFLYKRFITISELQKFTSWETLRTSSNILLAGFLVILGILITILRDSGAAKTIIKALEKKITTQKQAELATLTIANSFFFDDYFSILTVGSTIQHITNALKIPAIKIALIINTIAAPLAVLVPISSWVAEISGQIKNSGVAQNGTLVIGDSLSLYLASIPFMFYPIIVFISIWALVYWRFSYGIIKKHEKIASATGNLLGNRKHQSYNNTTYNCTNKKNPTLRHFIVPLSVLVTSILCFILYIGGWHYCGGPNTMLQALQNTNIYASFFIGGTITLLITITLFLFDAIFSIHDIWQLCKEGYFLMQDSLIMLLLMWTLSSILSKDLETGNFLAIILSGLINKTYIACTFFVLSLIIATMIGTAWGAIGIILPLGLGMLPNLFNLPIPYHAQDIPALFSIIGAIISGSMVGNHISPIADVMLFTATSTGANHDDIVRAQTEFAIPAIIATTIAYLALGLMMQSYKASTSIIISLLIGIMLNITILWGITKITTKKS